MSLLKKMKTGYAWGDFRGANGRQNTSICCVVARALVKPIRYPDSSALLTTLRRRLNNEEAQAIINIDGGVGRPPDAKIALRLAKKMGVRP